MMIFNSEEEASSCHVYKEKVKKKTQNKTKKGTLTQPWDAPKSPARDFLIVSRHMLRRELTVPQSWPPLAQAVLQRSSQSAPPYGYLRGGSRKQRGRNKDNFAIHPYENAPRVQWAKVIRFIHLNNCICSSFCPRLISRHFSKEIKKKTTKQNNTRTSAREHTTCSY